MSKLTWSLLIDPPAELVQQLRSDLADYNVQHSAIAESMDLAVFVRDEKGVLAGGISGNLWGGCLEIDFLWVSKKRRGNKLGALVLKKMEAEALSRGAKTSFLHTFSFQSPEFYEKNGYQVMAVIEGYPGEVKKYFMKKSLA